jgi:hypothetical protein
MKMAQVEYTSVLLALLRRHRLETVPLDGESVEKMHARLDARLRDSVSILTLQMTNIYDIEDDHGGLPLKLVRRK